ncbi:hypothetical protein B0H14DRAFT_3479408 [Mycena olivaceomarginata]|nr:hypothetical protein B0H14DRAFT_3479408 [Mycena olivaceomarginata]
MSREWHDRLRPFDQVPLRLAILFAVFRFRLPTLRIASAGILIGASHLPVSVDSDSNACTRLTLPFSSRLTHPAQDLIVRRTTASTLSWASKQGALHP